MGTPNVIFTSDFKSDEDTFVAPGKLRWALATGPEWRGWLMKHQAPGERAVTGPSFGPGEVLLRSTDSFSCIASSCIPCLPPHPPFLVAEQAGSEKWMELPRVRHQAVSAGPQSRAPSAQPAASRVPGACAFRGWKPETESRDSALGLWVCRAWRGNQQSRQTFWRRQVWLQTDTQRGGRGNLSGGQEGSP